MRQTESILGSQKSEESLTSRAEATLTAKAKLANTASLRLCAVRLITRTNQLPPECILRGGAVALFMNTSDGEHAKHRHYDRLKASPCFFKNSDMVDDCMRPSHGDTLLG